MNHVLYGFGAGFRHRRFLAGILRATPSRLATETILPEELRESGVTALALDFDGVLACHGQPEPLPAIREWLDRCCRVFGEERLFILSNKPAPVRIEWFRRHHPGIRFISGVRKKPYPDGLLQVAGLAGARPGEVMLLDDRLLTGVLAAGIAGTRITYITAPYVDLAASPLHELFFMALRSMERAVVGLCRG